MPTPNLPAKRTKAMETLAKTLTQVIESEFTAMSYDLSTEIDMVVDLWGPFLEGEWVQDVPTVPGTYPTADRSGYYGPDVVVGEAQGVLYYDGKTECPWNAWFWSEPRPPMPPAPLVWDQPNKEQ